MVNSNILVRKPDLPVQCNGKDDAEYLAKVELIDACEAGDVLTIRALLSDHALDVNGFMIDHHFEAPLHTVCKRGHFEAFQCLIQLGADIKHNGSVKQDMLINHAIRGSNMDIVQCLIERGCEVNKVDGLTLAPLCLAASLGQVDSVRHLLSAGSDYTLKDIRGRDALFHATVARSPQIARLLLEAGADVNTCDYNNVYVVAVAARRGYLDMLQLFIDAGCDVNVCVRSEDSPLTVAIESGHFHAAELLLKAGALPDLDPDLGKGSSLWTMLSTNHCRLDILSLILRAGCSAKQNQHCSLTPLQFAVQKGWWDAAYMILNADIDPVKEWEWICQEIRDDSVKEAEILCDVVRQMISSPASLLRQTRGVVHRNLNIIWPYWERVKNLPLPSYLKEYLLYNV